jgi:hypothetical protein
LPAAAVANAVARVVQSDRPWKTGSVPSMTTLPSIAGPQMPVVSAAAATWPTPEQFGSPRTMARYDAKSAVVIERHSASLTSRAP